MIQVPGSSANLGAGFDTLALALELFVRVEGRPRRSPKRVRLQGPCVDGLPEDDSNLIWQAFSRTLGPRAPDLELDVYNEIPLGRGLGSSGAAAVAGVALASQARGLNLSSAEILTRAVEIEGHPDNVSASVLGGLAVYAGGQAVSLPWPSDVKVLVAIPGFQLATSKARAALPEMYSRADAVFNIQRAAQMVAATAMKRSDLLREALGDRLHQPYRAALVPGLAEALAFDLPGLLGVALSGAGPSILALVSDPGPARVAFEDLLKRMGGGEVRLLAVAQQGIGYC